MHGSSALIMIVNKLGPNSKYSCLIINILVPLTHNDIGAGKLNVFIRHVLTTFLFPRV